MKIFSKSRIAVSALFTLLILGISGHANAALDSEGYPIVYLRGEFGAQNWTPDDNYKFTRQGNTYTLEIGAGNPVEGRFKIGDADWGFDFGGQNNSVSVNTTSSLTLKRSGSNLSTNGIYEGTISFTYTTFEAQNLNVSFNVASSDNGVRSDVSGTLPVMYINVYTGPDMSEFNNDIISYDLEHKNYFENAVYWLDANGCEWMEGAESIGSADNPLPLEIKARGNWTRWGFSKKPFKIKLGKKQNLLGLTPEKSKHYALLAHADDTYGYLRNYTAFNLGKRIGLPWTPDMQPVEVVINGDYRGLYFLTESIRVGDGRLDIAELDDKESDPKLVSGGYVVELDNYDEENQFRLEEKSYVWGQNLQPLRITWDTPEDYSDIQLRFVKEQFEAINDCVGVNSDDMWRYLDLDDAARYYLVWEIVGHTESFHGSTYLFRDRGEAKKWHFSPLWDAGNAFRASDRQFFYDCDPFGNTWIPSMRVNDKFNNKVSETWLWFMQNKYQGLEDDMALFVDHLRTAVKNDAKRWKNERVPSGGQAVADNSNIDSKLTEVKSYLSNRISWLKSVFGDYTAGTFTEPERDDTKAAPLPDYVEVPDEPVVDPEEPGDEPVVDPEEPGDEPVVDPEEPGDEPVVDPEEPGDEPVVDPDEPGDEPVVDPEEPGNEPVVDPEEPGDEPVVDPVDPEEPDDDPSEGPSEIPGYKPDDDPTTEPDEPGMDPGDIPSYDPVEPDDEPGDLPNVDPDDEPVIEPEVPDDDPVVDPEEPDDDPGEEPGDEPVETPDAGIDDIYMPESQDPEFYTLQGIRVMHPQSGVLYIMKKGNKTTKIIFP